MRRCPFAHRCDVEGGGEALGEDERVAGVETLLEEEGRAEAAQLALGHDGDAIGEDLSLVEEMRREHDRAPLEIKRRSSGDRGRSRGDPVELRCRSDGDPAESRGEIEGERGEIRRSSSADQAQSRRRADGEPGELSPRAARAAAPRSSGASAGPCRSWARRERPDGRPCMVSGKPVEAHGRFLGARWTTVRAPPMRAMARHSLRFWPPERWRACEHSRRCMLSCRRAAKGACCGRDRGRGGGRGAREMEGDGRRWKGQWTRRATNDAPPCAASLAAARQ